MSASFRLKLCVIFRIDVTSVFRLSLHFLKALLYSYKLFLIYKHSTKLDFSSIMLICQYFTIINVSNKINVNNFLFKYVSP